MLPTRGCITPKSPPPVKGLWQTGKESELENTSFPVGSAGVEVEGMGGGGSHCLFLAALPAQEPTTHRQGRLKLISPPQGIIGV